MLVYPFGIIIIIKTAAFPVFAVVLFFSNSTFSSLSSSFLPTFHFSNSSSLSLLQVVLAVLGICSAFPFIPDDPEVAAEKARFFKTFQIIEGATRPRGGSAIAVQPAIPPQLFTQPRPQPKWMGPLASKVPASLPGSTPFVSETPEVNHARAHFFNTYKSQIAATMPRPGSPDYYYSPGPSSASAYEEPPKKWTGPLASDVPASLPGSSPVVFDTPEVANAKANFLDTYKRQVAAVVPKVYY